MNDPWGDSFVPDEGIKHRDYRLKQVMWRRWEVTVHGLKDPEWVLNALADRYHDRGTTFEVLWFHVEGSDLKLIVEYTAKGANSHDVRKRITQVVSPWMHYAMGPEHFTIKEVSKEIYNRGW